MNKIVIEKKDLVSNIKTIKKLAGKSKVIAVVKYNGYGLGLIEYTKVLMEQGIENFAVCNVEEALRLREVYNKIEILNMSSTANKEDINLMIKNNIIITIGSRESYEAAVECTRRKEARAHLKIDTGLGRYGFLPEEIDAMRAVLNTRHINVEGVFSHFSISFYDEAYTNKQFDLFNKVVNELESDSFKFKMKHICNSSSFLLYKNMHLDAVRVGSAFLGRINIPNKYKLKRIGYLESEVSDIKTLPGGHNVGYSNTYNTNKETRVAIIPCGSIDGLNIEEGRNKTRVIDKIYYMYTDFKRDIKGYKHYAVIEGKKYEVIGGVDYSHMVVDITGSDVKIGDKAVFDINTFYANPSIKREYR